MDTLNNCQSVSNVGVATVIPLHCKVHKNDETITLRTPCHQANTTLYHVPHVDKGLKPTDLANTQGYISLMAEGSNKAILIKLSGMSSIEWE